jgi:hypothetical protein
VNLGDNNLEKVKSFTYFENAINLQEGTDAKVKTRIGKARASYKALKNIWRSHLISPCTIIRLFNSNVKLVLLYGAETWRGRKTTIKKVQTFISSFLRGVLKIQWPVIISNQDL